MESCDINYSYIHRTFLIIFVGKRTLFLYPTTFYFKLFVLVTNAERIHMTKDKKCLLFLIIYVVLTKHVFLYQTTFNLKLFLLVTNAERIYMTKDKKLFAIFIYSCRHTMPFFV